MKLKKTISLILSATILLSILVTGVSASDTTGETEDLSKYICNLYDMDKYTSPVWKGNIVYNEAIFPEESEDGGTTYTLMYTPDDVISVYDAQFINKYTEGVDYTVSGNKITFKGSIKTYDYSYIHPTEEGSTGAYYPRIAMGNDGYELITQHFYITDYINVTYTHSDSWTGYVPTQRSSELPNTSAAISGKKDLNVVYFGDSICGGYVSSKSRDIYPYASYWNEQITEYLEENAGVNVNAYYEAVGGASAASDSVESVSSSVTSHDPDLVFIEYGVNDAQNAAAGDNYSASDLKSEFKSAIKEMIDEIKASNPDCEIVLISPEYSNIYLFYSSSFEACEEALLELDDEYEGVVTADVTAMERYLLTFKKINSMCGDNLCHPNDFMQRIFSQVCLETIMPGGISEYIPDDTSGNETENPTAASPSGHGWYWDVDNAYGLIDGYDTNSKSYQIDFDLCLLPSTETSICSLWTNGSGNMVVAPAYLQIGSTKKSYHWGTLGKETWKHITYIIDNGNAQILIDGESLISGSGIIPYTEYQLLFSQYGSMMIDNLILKNLDGTVLVDCDFENATLSASTMGSGKGVRTLLDLGTIKYDMNGGTGTIPNQIKLSDTDIKLSSIVPEKDGYTFLGWSDDKSATTSEYDPGSTYSGTSDVTLYAVWRRNGDPDHPVVINSVTPLSTDFTGKGTVSFKVDAEGTDLTYHWLIDDLYVSGKVSGADTDTLTIHFGYDCPSGVYTAHCTVTNSYGSYQVTDNVTVNYTHIEPITINSVTPVSAEASANDVISFTVDAEGVTGLSYKWIVDDAISSVASGTDSSVLLLSFNSGISSGTYSAYCIVSDSEGNSLNTQTVTVKYTQVKLEILSITPLTQTISGKSSVTYTVDAVGEGLTYKWNFYDSRISARAVSKNTKSVTVFLMSDVPSGKYELDCTVSDSSGNSVTSGKVILDYVNTSVSVNIGNGTGSGTYEKGDTVTITASPADGMNFYKWNDASGISYTDAYSSSTSFVITGDTNEISLTYDTFMTCDTDDDSKFNAKDILLLRKSLADLVTLGTKNSYIADCNRDGVVNAKDLLYARKHAVGLI